MNILIMGGYGYTGKLIAKHLLVETKHCVIVAGRNLEKGEALARELASERINARRIDAADPNSLDKALHDVDFLVVAAPTTHQTQTVVEAAIKAGVDYLDVQISDEKLKILNSHVEEIESKQLCFVTEAGYHPGLPSAMVFYAATQMDCLESALTAGYLNMGNMPPYTEAVDELMECFLHYQAQVLKNGQWTKPTSYDIRNFDFGKEIGKRDCYSMFFEELRDLPVRIPTLKEAGFYISGAGWLSDTLTMLVMLGLKIAPERGLRPMGKLMWWSMTKLSKAPYRVALMVEARGQKNGAPLKLRTLIEHEDGYELTAIPVVAFLMQYDGVRRPGLHMLGHIAEPNRLFEDMQHMGVRITTCIVP
jgi:saccharopine dehydrogenase-like NADP-dependent oxidoreductase